MKVEVTRVSIIEVSLDYRVTMSEVNRVLELLSVDTEGKSLGWNGYTITYHKHISTTVKAVEDVQNVQ